MKKPSKITIAVETGAVIALWTHAIYISKDKLPISPVTKGYLYFGFLIGGLVLGGLIYRVFKGK